MNKELYVSSTPHETKVALVEDDQLAEVYFERENEYTLAGSIYKGRVTRVLPGMQSAFVDIGLERDAFLYVSDFLELGEEEDEELGQVQLQPHLIDPNKPAPPVAAPVEAEAEEFDDTEDESGEEQGAEARGSEETSEQDEGGSRRWRGRRRRRGRRGGRERVEGREQAQAEPAATQPEAEEPLPESEEEESVAPPHQPAAEVAAPSTPEFERILLPGESIARYQNRGADEQTEEPQGEERHAERESRHDRGGRGRFGRRGRFEKRERREEEPYELPSNYEPIVLPGESISKYRNQPAAAAEIPAFEAKVTEAEQPVPEPEVASFAESHPQPEETLAANVADVAPVSEERAVVAGEDHSQPAGVESRVDEEKTEERFEHMNVASVFGGDAVEEENTSAESPAVEAVHEDTNEDAAAAHETGVKEQAEVPEQHQAGSYVIEGGNVEHEEIDEEEADIGTYEEEVDQYQAHDFEEETLDARGGRISGEVVGDAVRESEEEAVLEDEEYEFNGNGQEEGDEFEESELVAEGEDEELENGRAELRAPAGTAAYQQRADRPGYERRGFDRNRGRRGRRGMRPRREHRPVPAISDLLKEGQEVLIQIAKEPIGKKGARITSHIALPGRFLVYMPTVNHIGVSRKINSDDERQRLKRIVASERENGHGGFIVRTAAANVREEELRADIRFLKHLWTEIRTRAENSKSPSLIYHDLNLVERVLRDQVTSDFSQIWVDTQEEYERVVRFASRFQPGLLKRIKLYTKDVPLYEQFGIQEEINKSLKSKVWLKSGGYIVINQTEALVAIDINTGKYVGKTARLEDTIVKTNCDAIREIVRQIRLRDLGGIIVIDFIDMDEKKNRQKVMQTLEEALKADRAPSKVLQFNDFGLVAITRKRVKQSLERTLGTPCPYCTATGFVKSPSTIANEIFVEMRKIRKQVEKEDVIVRVNPEVAKELKTNNGKRIQELEELVGQTVLVKSDPQLHQEQFDINF